MRVPTRKDREPILQLSDEELEGLPEAEEIPPPAKPLPMVAIVGRPNVGKSTLFNRIIGRRKAVVHDLPGVTRDRNIARAEWDGISFLCVDTGGYDVGLDDPLLESVMEQVKMAMDEADVIVLLAAVGEDAHPADEQVIRLLRGADKPVFLAVNKCDSPKAEMEATDFYRYGFDKIYPVAALHGVGVADLLSDVLKSLRHLEHPPSHNHLTGGIALAIVGRQNVGKSTLVNKLCGEERVIASALPGTTRDAIDTVIQTPEGKLFTLIDTAGIRRRGKVERGVEKLSVFSAMYSLERADVACVLIDAARGISEQDAHVAGYCLDAGLPTMILVNKWDIVEKDHRTADQFTKTLEQEWGVHALRAGALYIGEDGAAGPPHPGDRGEDSQQLAAAGGDARAQRAAGGVGRQQAAGHGQEPAAQGTLHDADRDASADLHPVRQRSRAVPFLVCALHHQPPAGGFRFRGDAGQDSAPQEQDPRRRCADQRAAVSESLRDSL